MKIIYFFLLIYLGITPLLGLVQARDRIGYLEWQFQQNEARIRDADRSIEEVERNLTTHRSRQSHLARQLQRCSNNRLTRRISCRRQVNRRLSETQKNIAYWTRALSDRQNNQEILRATRSRLNMELRSERLLARCFEQQQNRSAINEILNAEAMKIAQETDYDSADNGRCNDQNNWFQDQLDSSHDTQDFDQSLDQRCTYRALKEFSDCQGRRRTCFVKCEGESPQNDRPEYTSTAPCVSRRLHHSVHQAITEISSCFQLDPKILFSLFLAESGTHPLVRSYTNATGTGQITGIFIRDINNNLFDLYKDEILPALSRNPLRRQACRSVRNKINTFGKINPNGSCSRTNLYMNTFYSAVYYLRNYEAIARKVLRVRGQRNASIPENSSFRDPLEGDISRSTRRLFENSARLEHLNSNDRNIITELAFYSHNHPRTITVFQTYLDDPNEDPKLTDNFIGQQGQWLSYLERNKEMISTNPTRQDEVSKYIYKPSIGGPGGGYRILLESDSFMRGHMARIERESKNPDRERIYCRPY